MEKKRNEIICPNSKVEILAFEQKSVWFYGICSYLLYNYTGDLYYIMRCFQAKTE